MTADNDIQLKELHSDEDAAVRLIPIKISEHEKSYQQRSADSIPFTEALSLTKFGKFNYCVIFLSGIILGNVLLETATIGFILPIAQCDLQLTNQDKGVLSAIGFVGIILSSHLWGFLADTKGRRRVIRPTLITAFVVTLFSSFANSFWLMVMLRLLNGFFVSGGSGTVYAYLGEFHTDKTRSRAMMGASFVFALGAMTLPFIAFLILNQEWILPIPYLDIDYKPWRFFMVVCGFPGVICGLTLFFLPESPKFLLLVNKEKEAIEVLQKIHKWNGGKEMLKITHIQPEFDDASNARSETVPIPVSDSTLGLSNKVISSNSNSNLVFAFLQAMWQQTVPLFYKKYLRTTLIVCTLQFWLYVVTNGLYMWFPHIINSMSEFMNQHPGEEKRICQIVYEKNEQLYKTDGAMECVTKLEDSTYFYSLIMEIMYVSSFATIGLIINRVGKIPILFITIISFTLCGLAGVFVADPSIAAYLYVLFFLVGASINVLGAATVELYPTNMRAMAICISLMFGRVGSVVGANIVGALLGTHCELTFYISCGALLICAFMTLWIPRNGIEKPTKETSPEA